MKNRYTLIFFTLITSFLTAQVTVNFSEVEGYTDGQALDANDNWGGQFMYINTTNESVSTQSNAAEAYWGQSQPITEGETITFEVDMKFGGDLNYTTNIFIAQIGFNAGGTTSSGGSERQWIYLKALANGKLKIEKRGGGNLTSTPSYSQGPTIPTWNNEDLTVKVSFLLGNSAATSRITAKLINNTTGVSTDAVYEENVVANVYNAAVSGNLYGFFRMQSLQIGDTEISAESFTVSRVKLVNEDTLFPSIFFNTNADNQWGTAANWNPAYVPTSYTDVKILVNQSIQIASSTTALANTIVVNSGGSLTIDQTSSLTVSDDFENNGTVTLNSGGSLIVNGTSSGDVTYNRTLGTDNWYLVSSPVAGETYNDAYITANSIDLGTGSNRGIGTYTSSSDSWAYMQTGDVDATFNQGQGYAVKRSAAGDVSFTGALNVANAGVDVVLSSDVNRFNLLGNPYTSHINSSTFLANEGAVSETKTLWVWNQANGAYEVKTLADAMVIAPAQGFFVKANMGGGTFNFDESNQDSSGGTFQRTEARPEMVLTLSDQSDVREAKIYYIENMTLGFDVGYEGELFNGVSNPLAIFTHLIADSEGKNYQVQSLPDNDFENTIIPLGINAISGSSISIEASKNNFPEGMNIYLEDKQDNSFTLLEVDANFNTTLENDLSGIGRFFLHTTSSTLSANDLATSNNFSIYSSNRETLRVVGVQNGTANLQIFNLLGKEVLRSSFEGSGVNDISLPKLALGVYIVKVNMQTGQLNKKIIIE
jgi:hypothetical protein